MSGRGTEISHPLVGLVVVVGGFWTSTAAANIEQGGIASKEIASKEFLLVVTKISGAGGVVADWLGAVITKTTSITIAPAAAAQLWRI